MSISGTAIRQPVFTTMVMAALVVLGLFSYGRLSIDEYPDVSIPIVSIQTVYPGASPDAVEREVTEPIEESLNTIEGIDEIRSVSLEGVSVVTAEFELDVDESVAAEEVRSKLDRLRGELPAEIEAPVIEKFDPAARPILSLALSSETESIRDLTRYADDVLEPRIEAVSGVASVDIVGGLEREVRVELRSGDLTALGIGVTDVIAALRSQNLEVPAGRLERGDTERPVRVMGRFDEPADFGEVIVAVREGVPIRLADVADIRDATQEERSVALVDGDRAVALDIRKVSGSNTVAVAEDVKTTVEALAAALPAGLRLRVVQDNSTFIEESVRDVQIALVLGAVLTVVVVFLFLGDARATTITALSLPVSVISAFLIMDALDFTLNTMTLMALSLSVGFLIDDAIVVIENIVRHRGEGKPARAAAEEAVREIALAVMATTFTIIAVFVPVAFMEGLVGKFFYQFGLTVAWAVLVSLFVSFTLTPMLAARWTGAETSHESGRNGVAARLTRRLDGAMDRLADGYARLLGWTLDHRWTTIGIAVASLLAGLALVPVIGGEFMTSSDRGYFYVFADAPAGSSLGYTSRKLQDVERGLRALPGVDYTYATVGAGLMGTVDHGEILVALHEKGDRSLHQREIMQRARTDLAPLHGLDLSVLESGKMGEVEKPIQVDIRGADVKTLAGLSADVLLRLEDVPGAIELETTLSEAKPEYRVRVRRELAAAVGLSVGQVAAAMRPALAGEEATTWEAPDGSTYDVVVRLPLDRRAGTDDLARLPLASVRRDPLSQGAVVLPLAQVADVEQGTGPAQLDRKNLERVVTVQANVAPDANVMKVSGRVRDALSALELPAGYTIALAGETSDFEETRGYMAEALLLSVLLIYMILASQFGSFLNPVVIMTALPLSLVGALLALLITGDTINIMSMIGIILLMGLVTKNSILLVDFANELRRRGESRRRALVQAGRIRLRPILMTALTLIFGVLPVALAIGQGAEFRAPMARAVIGGMTTATFLTLVVIPVIYALVDDGTDRLRAWTRRTRRAAVTPDSPRPHPAP